MEDPLEPEIPALPGRPPGSGAALPYRRHLRREVQYLLDLGALVAAFAFALPGRTEVRLGVYDVSGRLIRTLLTGVMPAGRHRVRWDGRDGEGRGVASGIYFARLQAADVTEIEAMTLIR